MRHQSQMDTTGYWLNRAITLIRHRMYGYRKRAIVAFWSRSRKTWNNVGDAINPALLSDLTGRPVIHRNDITRNDRDQKPTLVAAGSILERIKFTNAVIWGTGAKDAGDYSYLRSAKVFAVRGPLSQHVLKRSGVDVPDVYGDPVLLLPRMRQFSHLSIDRSGGLGTIGIVPHYLDIRFKGKRIRQIWEDAGFEFIDVKARCSKVVKQIHSCDVIASSSLHGLIIADAFSIPRVWIESAGHIAGGDYKFLDYHESLGVANAASFQLKDVRQLPEIRGMAISYPVDHLLRNLMTALTNAMSYIEDFEPYC